MRVNSTNSHQRKLTGFLLGCLVFVMQPGATLAQGPARITLDEAIQLALQHNHTLLAARTTILQTQAQEITANLRPNPVLIGDWEYLPLFSPSYWTSSYLHDLTEVDLGLSYLIERGHKRARRLEAAAREGASEGAAVLAGCDREIARFTPRALGFLQLRSALCEG